MTAKELSLKYSITPQSIRAKAKKALENNTTLTLKEQKYKVKLISNAQSRGKSYTFEPITQEKKTLKLSSLDKKWMQAPENKKQEAILKARLMALWEKRDNSLKFDTFILSLPNEFKELNITQATFFRWLKAVREAKEKNIPPSYALLDSRGGDRGTKKLTKEQEEFLVSQFLKNPTIKKKRLWLYLKDKFSDVPSYSTVERFIKKYINSNPLLVEFASNPSKAISKYRPAFGKMDANITYANQLWELDATPADIITAEGKRYTISAAIDVYSRRVVVVLEESASFTTLSNLFRKAIKTFGIPDSVKTDNGKDYTSNNFDLMCQRLQIEHILVPPYSGYYKPHIERFFRTLSHELFEDLPGYIGHSVADREAITNRQTFEQKLKAQAYWREQYKNGNDFAKKFALKLENKGTTVQIPLTKDELQEWIDKWIITYENRLHRGINTKPIDKWNSSSVPVKRVSDIRILNILVGLSQVKKITKKGITLNKIVYTAPELWEFVGESVLVLTDDELGKVYVYDQNYNYITTATSDEHIGKSRAEYVKATKAFDKKIRKLTSILEELRAEDTNLMQEHIDKQLNKIQNKPQEEIGYEYKNDLTKGVIEALEDNKEEVHEELKDDSIVPTVDAKPVFNSPYDRFIYELKNNCVSEKTLKLAKKYPQSWEAAQRAAS